MSTPDDTDPLCPPPPPGIETVIVPRARDLGGFEVRRALPSARSGRWSAPSSSSTRWARPSS